MCQIDKFLNIKYTVIFDNIFRHFPLASLATNYHCFCNKSAGVEYIVAGLVVNHSEDMLVDKNMY